jgi:hypothetical protein
LEVELWIIGQILIDAALVALLVWFVKFNEKRRIPWQDFDAVYEKSRGILSEMKEISLSLERNLEEKRQLSRLILAQLDEGIERAEESSRQVLGMVHKSDTMSTQASTVMKDSPDTRASISALFARGVPKEDIAQHLGISLGEVELFVKLKKAEKLARSQKGY